MVLEVEIVDVLIVGAASRRCCRSYLRRSCLNCTRRLYSSAFQLLFHRAQFAPQELLLAVDTLDEVVVVPEIYAGGLKVAPEGGKAFRSSSLRVTEALFQLRHIPVSCPKPCKEAAEKLSFQRSLNALLIVYAFKKL